MQSLYLDGRFEKIDVVSIMHHYRHGVYRNMISVVIFFVFLRLLFFALLLLYVT